MVAGLLEPVAVVTGFVCVYLNIRQNIWTWPAAIVSSALFALVFYGDQLYATMALQGLFIGVSIYGWHAWLHGGANGGRLWVSRISRRTGVVLLLLTVAGTIALVAALDHWTDSEYPRLDGLTTAMSVAASWMAARKILESWLVWIVTDAIYVGLFAFVGLYFTLALYALYLGMAVAGLLAWRRSWLNSAHQRHPA